MHEFFSQAFSNPYVWIAVLTLAPFLELRASIPYGILVAKEHCAAVVLTAVVNWKNLNTGQLMINNKTVMVAASYSQFQDQNFTYASALAANKLARKIVELMENNW